MPAASCARTTAALGQRAEEAVGPAGAVAGALEQELERGDVPAPVAVAHHPAAEAGPPAPAEGVPRSRPGDPVDVEPAAALEGAIPWRVSGPLTPSTKPLYRCSPLSADCRAATRAGMLA